ncbi:MAG: class I SAM-dependent methyltransferase [bacterium]|nr:class I SAM-dependent methyltransferase [bacterium]
MPDLIDSLSRAFAARTDLLASLSASGTDCYRLFHGTVEGMPGLTVDRYGEVLLVQSFHVPLETKALEGIEDWYRREHPLFARCVYNDRSAGNSRVANALAADAQAIAEAPVVIHELGVRYVFRARHRGQDPWLFLDLRAARRQVQALMRNQAVSGQSVLNLFSYTCGVGVAAAVAGASRVLNVDFAASGLAVGRENAALNAVADRVGFLESDYFPAARQLAGLEVPKGRRGQSLPSFPRVGAEPFDLVFLDPPRYAKSAFGVVDLVNDYGAVFKPALLATREGGTLIACNNVASVDRDAWAAGLQGAIRRNGRTLRSLEFITPDADFPSPDGRPPLKAAMLRV